MKRIFSLILSLIMVFGIVTGMDVSVFAADTEVESYEIYKADKYAELFDDIFVGTGSSSYARNFYNEMINDDLLMGEIVAWESLHLIASPSYSLESGMITKYDYFKTVLFDLIISKSEDKIASAAQDNFEYLFDQVKNSKNSFIVSSAKKILASEDGLTAADLKGLDLTDESKNLLLNGTRFAESVELTSDVMQILEWCDNVYDAIELTANYCALTDVYDGTKEVLQYIADDTSNNEDLRLAATACIECMGDSYTEVVNSMTVGAFGLFSDVAGAFIDEAWKALVATIPGGSVALFALQGGRAIVNLLMSQDDKTKAYYQIEANVICEDAIIRAMSGLKNAYLNNKTEANAVTYLRAVEMYKDDILFGFDYSIDLLEVLVEANLSTIIGTYNKGIELINDLYSYKSQKLNNFLRLEDAVNAAYRNTYMPDYNTVINDYNNQAVVEVESISLKLIDEINIGDTGYIGNYIDVIKYPENANDLFVEDFVSLNEDVIKLNEFDFIEVVGTGECTIVCKQGTEFETTITVTVGETSADDTVDYLGDFSYTINSDGTTATITGYTGTQSRLIIPSVIDGYDVTSIGNTAFQNCDWLTSITIPDSVASIGCSAFESCSSLISIIIPSSVTCLNNYVFRDCKSLISIKIPDSVINIGAGAFQNCNSLTEITIPYSVRLTQGSFYINSDGHLELLGSNSTISFLGCNSIKKIHFTKGSGIYESVYIPSSAAFPDSLDSIYEIYFDNGINQLGKFAFCKNLSLINLPEGITNISSYCFYECNSVSKIDLPSKIVYIGEYAFYNCSSLTEIFVPDGVNNIYEYTFAGCSSLKNMTISDNVTNIGEWAFSGCEAVSYLKMPCSIVVEGKSNADYIGLNNVEYVIFTPGSGIMTDFNVATSPISDSRETLKEVVFEEGIEHIGSYVCYGCDKITSITLPKSIKSISNYAFQYCNNIEKVNYLGQLADWCEINFNQIYANPNYYANNLYIDGKKIEGHIEIPDGVTVINKSVFENCKDITSITIPNSVTTIELGAFSGCSSLGFISIPDSVKTIEMWAFESSGLHCIKLGKGLENIKDRAFLDCSIDHVYFAGSEEQWEAISGTFGSYKTIHYMVSDNDLCEFKSTILPSCTEEGYNVYCCSICGNEHYDEYVDSLGHDGIKIETVAPDCIFEGYTVYCCNTCNQEYRADYVDALGAENHNYINGICTICQDGNAEELGFDFRGGYIYNYFGESVEIVIPETINGKKVISISEHSFSGNDKIISVTIPHNVKHIGWNAFYNCTSLTSITIPDSVTSIGDSAFMGCTSLISITIPDSVTSIADSTFYNCSNLTSVTIGNSVKSIATSAFRNCASLTSIIIPNGVISIGNYAFYNCTNLNSVTIPNSVTSIGDDTFCGCTSLTSITIPNSVTSIGDGTFRECTILTSVIIPDSVTNIGDGAFSGCSSLTSIIIPDSVTSIGDSAFEACTNLTTITIPNSVIFMGDGAFSWCPSLTSIIIPDGITSIGDEVFRGCSSIKSITIPDSVIALGDSAFDDCSSLILVTIPDSVTSIGNYAFSGCSSLTSITIPNSVTSIGNYAFSWCKSLTSIIMPDGVTSIGECSFYNCTSLTLATIPDRVTSIGYAAFDGCANLKDVYYSGSKDDWFGVSVDSYNSHLNSCRVHYNVTSKDVPSHCNLILNRESTCTEEGTIKISCLCGYEVSETVPALGHNWVDAICSVCGIEQLPESEHPYSANCDDTQTIYREGAANIDVCFSDDTYTEAGFDEIYIYDGDDRLVGTYSGSDLAGETVNVSGDTVKIRLTSDSSVQAYGYRVLSVTANYEVDCTHNSVSWIVDMGATCETNGSRHSVCDDCGETIETETIYATGHIASNWAIEREPTCTEVGLKQKVCTICGKVVETDVISATGHNSNSWITDKKATVNAKGKKHKECTECGEVLETATIKQLKCSKPKLKEIENTTSGVKITWGKVSGADKYYVYRKTGSSGKYSKIATVKGNSKVTYTDKSAKSGKKYCYYVKAVNEAGSSSASSSKSIYHLADTTLSTPKSTKRGITLKWKKVIGADGYMVYRKTGSGSYSKIATVKGNSKVTYTDKSAKKGKTYTYKVKAYKSKTYSAYSNAKKIKDKY